MSMDHRDTAIANEVEEIVAAIRALRRDLFRNPAEDAARAGVTGPQVSVMMCVVAKGPLSLTEISRMLGMSHSTASGIVDRLEARGFMRRITDPTDRRRTRISVTRKVARYASRVETGPFGRLAEGLAKATVGERRAIRKGLRILRELFGQIP